MTSRPPNQTPTHKAAKRDDALPLPPLPPYTLSTVCPGCGSEMFKLACKVRCKRCGFVWDCSEL